MRLRGAVPADCLRGGVGEVPFTLVVVALGLVVGLLAGGRLRHLRATRLSWVGALLAGLTLQVLVDLAAARGLVPAALATGALFVSEVLVLAFVVANRRLPGMWLVGVGFALNALVILANGAMPVDPAAIERLGAGQPGELVGKHELLTCASHLPWLADRLPVAPLRVVLSPGDLVLAVGVVRLTVGLLRRCEPEEP